jgi:hypothetical protein
MEINSLVSEINKGDRRADITVNVKNASGVKGGSYMRAFLCVIIY